MQGLLDKQEHRGSVYAVPVGEDWLLHSPLQRFSALANREAIARIGLKM